MKNKICLSEDQKGREETEGVRLSVSAASSQRGCLQVQYEEQDLVAKTQQRTGVGYGELCLGREKLECSGLDGLRIQCNCL